MKKLSQMEMQALEGKGGFLCGAVIVLAIGATVASGAVAAGPGMIVAEWACAADYLFL